MRKAIAGLLAAGIMLLAIGCGSASGNTGTKVNETSGETKVEESAAAGSTETELQKGTESVANTSESDARTLIVYYSYSGATKRVAEYLQQVMGGSLYELSLKEPYSGDSNAVSDRVFAERDDGQMPELSGDLPDISNYDRILIGTPVWNASISNPVVFYLERTDFDGKIVAPFWTYVNDQGSTEKDFKEQCKNASLTAGLPVQNANGISDTELDKLLETWAKGI